ncbi:hypothetical protein F5884DRAFT_744933 [Xylogone sp. PMI_703]|nr:hypothetical protein F5884DRAFT_744933 [Xylogone sp. PMI_703]
MAAAKDKDSSGTAAKGGIPDSDATFLLCCIRNAGTIAQIDMNTVAKELGFSNPRSVGNKITMLKKKYNINFSTTGNTPTKQSSTTKIASKDRVRKTPAARKGRKTAVKETKVESEEEYMAESEGTQMKEEDEASSEAETEKLEVESQDGDTIKVEEELEA